MWWRGRRLLQTLFPEWRHPLGSSLSFMSLVRDAYPLVACNRLSQDMSREIGLFVDGLNQELEPRVERLRVCLFAENRAYSSASIQRNPVKKEHSLFVDVFRRQCSSPWPIQQIHRPGWYDRCFRQTSLAPRVYPKEASRFAISCREATRMRRVMSFVSPGIGVEIVLNRRVGAESHSLSLASLQTKFTMIN